MNNSPADGGVRHWSDGQVPNPPVSPEMMGGLPDPVQRCMTVSGVPGHPFQNNLRLRQEGTFRSAKDKPWMNVRAKQYFSAASAGFVWDASFSMAGIQSARTYDSHLDTQGRMFGRMIGLFTLMDSQGAGLSQGTRMRCLAELIWMPSAYLGETITWMARDGNSAIVTMQDDEGNLVNMEGQRYAVSRALTPQSDLQRTEHLLVAVYRPQHKYSITA